VEELTGGKVCVGVKKVEEELIGDKVCVGVKKVEEELIGDKEAEKVGGVVEERESVPLKEREDQGEAEGV